MLPDISCLKCADTKQSTFHECCSIKNAALCSPDIFWLFTEQVCVMETLLTLTCVSFRPHDTTSQTNCWRINELLFHQWFRDLQKTPVSNLLCRSCCSQEYQIRTKKDKQNYWFYYTAWMDQISFWHIYVCYWNVWIYSREADEAPGVCWEVSLVVFTLFYLSSLKFIKSFIIFLYKWVLFCSLVSVLCQHSNKK